MKHQRWVALQEGDNLNGPHLTQEEIQEGWHFCWDWDGLLVGPGMGEIESCTCGFPSVVKAKKQHLEQAGSFDQSKTRAVL